MEQQNSTQNPQDKENFSNEATVMPINGTPFATVNMNTHFTLVFGNSIVTRKKFTSRGAAIKHANKIDWEMIMATMAIYVKECIKTFKELEERDSE